MLTHKTKKTFSLNGKKDQYGNVDPGTSLIKIMSSCLDFVNNTTLLQETLGKRGVIVIRTPKCHSEVAGEGVEYSWGSDKNDYRRLPLHLKKSKENFLSSVKNVLSREHLTTKQVRKFARKVRAYTCAY